MSQFYPDHRGGGGGDEYEIALAKMDTKNNQYNRGAAMMPNDEMGFTQELVMDEHHAPIEELYNRYNTDPYRGMETRQVVICQERDGPNTLTKPDVMPVWIKIFRHVFSFFNIVLWMTASLCFISYGIMDGTYEVAPTNWLIMGIILLFIIFVSSAVMFYHDLRSDSILNSFERRRPFHAMVIRDGSKHPIPISELVMGDLVEVRAGDRVPADLRVIQAHGLKVDNSFLTGEQEPQVRIPDYTNPNPLETRNLMYSMTFVAEGWGRGIVVNIGDHTIVGRIANLASGMDVSNTRLAKQIASFTNIVLFCSILFGFVFFIFAFDLNYYWLESIVYMTAFVAACVPEGLGATVTVCMTLTASRMLKKNCLVKHLEAIELLGSTSTILMNLTGSLTKNEPIVSHVFADGRIIEADMENSDELYVTFSESTAYQMLMQNLLLANSASFKAGQDGIPSARKMTFGNSVDAAFLKFSSQLVTLDSNQFVKVTEFPFDSRFRLHIAIVEDRVNGYNFIVIKGPVLEVLQRCTSYLLNGVEVALEMKERQQVLDAMDDLSERGEKVVAVADLLLPPNQYPPGYPFDVSQSNYPMIGYRLNGLVSVVDPPRASAPAAIAKCKQAGIRPILITNEQPVVAKVKARELGLISNEAETIDEVADRKGIPVIEVNPRDASAAVVSGEAMDKMSPAQIDEMLVFYGEIVFAQISQQNKIAIIQSLKRLNQVVAATGGDISDVVALQRAHVGIGLAQSGTDIAMDAADIILLDDNFSSVINGIEEGRLIYDNVKKSILYVLTSNMPQVIPFFCWMILDIPMYIGLITILCIDLGTDIMPALSFAYEQPEDDIMKRQPRDPKNDNVINERLLGLALGQHGVIETAGAMFALFVMASENGFWPLRLIGARREWDGPGINDLEDSYGQEWSVSQRAILRYAMYSTYFIAIVICQWVMLFISRTRTQSLFRQPLNRVSLFALVFETILAILMIYIPGMDLALNMYPIRITWFFPVLPFALLMLGYDEFRKFWIRRYGAQSFFGRETLY